MFKIGLFSKLTQVSVRMLRYYDEQGILKPDRIDPETGYRLYSASQVTQAQRIMTLRDLKFSTNEIREILNNDDLAFYQSQLLNKQLSIQAEIQQEEFRLRQISRELSSLEKDVPRFDVTFKQVPSYPVLSLRKTIDSYYAESELWIELANFVKQYEITLDTSFPDNLTIFHDIEYREHDVDVEVCLKLPSLVEVSAPFACYRTDSEEMAVIFVKGPYENLMYAYQSFALWLEKHPDYWMLEPTRQVSHRGPENEDDPENYLTEIQIPIRKAERPRSDCEQYRSAE